MDISLAIRMQLSTVVFSLGLAESKSEAKRLIKQGGIRIDGHKVVRDCKVFPARMAGRTFQRGRRQFVRLSWEPVLVEVETWTEPEGEV